MKKEVLLFITLFMFAACKKEKSKHPHNLNQMVMPLASVYGGDQSFDAHFYIDNFGSVIENEQAYPGFSAEAKGVDGIQSDLGDINLTNGIVNRTVSFRGTQWAFPYKNTGIEESFLSSNNTITVSADGNTEFGSIQASVQAVDYLFLSKPTKDQIISSSSPISIEWNEQNSGNGVGIYIEILQAESLEEFPNDSFPSYISYEFVTDDDGEYVLSTDELLDFPGNCVLRIWIGRGNFTDFTTSTGKQCVLACYSMDIQRVIRN